MDCADFSKKKSHKLKFGPKMYFSNYKKLGNNTIKYIIINKTIKIYQRYFTGMSFPLGNTEPHIT